LPGRRRARGAPEFEVLRRRNARHGGRARDSARAGLEAERASALRESARQFAHELKNPVHAIRFAVDRLRG
jgi:nitrogen-specific signal transduction histidine kinase